MAQSRSYPYLLVHELVETSLIGKAGGSVLPDLAWGMPGLQMHVNNYTRWFRDGFANYAGFVAYEIVAGEVPSDKKLYQQEALVHTEPFSCLAQVGGDLFSWPQVVQSRARTGVLQCRSRPVPAHCGHLRRAGDPRHHP